MTAASLELSLSLSVNTVTPPSRGERLPWGTSQMQPLAQPPFIFVKHACTHIGIVHSDLYQQHIPLVSCFRFCQLQRSEKWMCMGNN